jgi:hypothetical protein
LIQAPFAALLLLFLGLQYCCSPSFPSINYYSLPIAKLPRVAYITAILGRYESQTKAHVAQTVPSDFICFTDSKHTANSGRWIIDRHMWQSDPISRSPLDTGQQYNSFSHNIHTFNQAKYFKCQFFRIPRLRNYDLVVWLDGTIEIRNPLLSEHLLEIARAGWPCATMNHDLRNGSLAAEVQASDFHRYRGHYWHYQRQPPQKVAAQWSEYVRRGYNDTLYNQLLPVYRSLVIDNPMGVWLTCLVSWNMHSPQTRMFLDRWYLEILNFTTQDQVSFAYLVQTLGLLPYTLPDNRFTNRDDYFFKHPHGS